MASDRVSDERIGDMTKRELISVIHREVAARDQETSRIKRLSTQHRDNRSVKEILESIDRRRITPAPGTPSTLELLREDRDR